MGTLLQISVCDFVLECADSCTNLDHIYTIMSWSKRLHEEGKICFWEYEEILNTLDDKVGLWQKNSKQNSKKK